MVTEYLLDVQPGLWKVIAADDGTDVNLYIHDPVTGRILQHEDPSNDWNWPALDGLGTVRGVYDGTLTEVYAADRDPYGDLIASTGSNPTPFEYTGEMRDANDLQYHRARYLDTNLGVWISEDPLETANRYAYVGGDPANRVDPSGLFDWRRLMIEPGDTLSCIAREAGLGNNYQAIMDYHNANIPEGRASFTHLQENLAYHRITNPDLIFAYYRLLLPPAALEAGRSGRHGCHCPRSIQQMRCAQPPIDCPSSQSSPVQHAPPNAGAPTPVPTGPSIPPPIPPDDTKYLTIGYRFDASAVGVAGMDVNIEVHCSPFARKCGVFAGVGHEFHLGVTAGGSSGWVFGYVSFPEPGTMSTAHTGGVGFNTYQITQFAGLMVGLGIEVDATFSGVDLFKLWSLDFSDLEGVLYFGAGLSAGLEAPGGPYYNSSTIVYMGSTLSEIRSSIPTLMEVLAERANEFPSIPERIGNFIGIGEIIDEIGNIIN